ncbi:hypothetical protein GCM10011390_50140 [Aureimonas endophytica]|uniref:Secreted protein n=1 Tax=Aureimonas endophytica TaxID=2027858 RepID=A0A917A398_9HYPH|nr:hypothetical protein [Aureimonas endophytica]GGE24674.1 hypothetical protein GCM10011390_50140 [Aureimonas endophytica]
MAGPSRRSFLAASVSAVAAAGSVAMMAPATSIAAPYDPLLDLIRRYEAEEARFNATPHETDEEAEADIVHLDELFYELRDNPPAPTTEAGAIAAVKLVHDFFQHSSGGIEFSLIAAAAAYFDGRTA